MIWQYFFLPLKFFSCFLPMSSCHFLQDLVKAFFRFVPVLAETHFTLIVDVLSKYYIKRRKASWDFTISHDVYNYCEWCFNNGYNRHNFLVFLSGFWSINFLRVVTHASFVAYKGGEVKRLGRVTLGKTLHFPTMPAQGLMPGSREFPVRHFAFTCCQ